MTEFMQKTENSYIWPCRFGSNRQSCGNKKQATLPMLPIVHRHPYSDWDASIQINGSAAVAKTLAEVQSGIFSSSPLQPCCEQWAITILMWDWCLQPAFSRVIHWQPQAVCTNVGAVWSTSSAGTRALSKTAKWMGPAHCISIQVFQHDMSILAEFNVSIHRHSFIAWSLWTFTAL